MPISQETQESVRKVLDKIHGLPTLPPVLSQINKIMVNPKASPKDVATLISNDPAITSRILRIANSSFYGFPNRITTVTHAIVILGFNSIKSIVLSSSIFDAFKKDGSGQGLDRNAFWKHSIGCGAAAKALGARLGFPTVEELFVAGLLHDMGKLILDQFFPEPFRKALGVVKAKNCLLVQAEEEVLGFTHAELGGMLFEKWNLSKGIIECVRFHHNPALAVEHLKPVEMIHVADVLVRTLLFGSGGDEKIPAIRESAWNDLGLRTDMFEGLLKDVDREIEKAMVFLDFI